MATGDGSNIVQEVALVSIQPIGGTAYQFAAIIDSMSFGGGEKQIEGVPVMNGGRLVKRTPMTDHEVSFTIYPTSTQFTSKDMIQLFALPSASWVTTTPQDVSISRGSDRYQVCILWTDDATATTANGTTVASKLARRYVLKSARCVSYASSFADRHLTAEVSFKAPAFTPSGTATLKIASNPHGSGSGLTAAAAYTTD